MVTTPHVRGAAGRIPLSARGAASVSIDVSRLAELVMLVAAGALLLISLLFPYWQITLHAPQYPKGLHIQAFAYKLTGDIFEVDGLNHYIGMMKLNDAALIERQAALIAIPAIALLAVGSFWLRGIWRSLARLPIILFPLVFAADLFGWLYYAGHSLDPHAPLSSSIKPFTPHIIGVGTIGQFSTEAVFLSGFTLAVVAALLALGVMALRGGRSDVAR